MLKALLSKQFNGDSFQTFFFGWAGERLTKRLRAKMFEVMLSMEVAWFDKSANSVAILCSKLYTDASAVQAVSGLLSNFRISLTWREAVGAVGAVAAVVEQHFLSFHLLKRGCYLQ